MRILSTYLILIVVFFSTASFGQEVSKELINKVEKGLNVNSLLSTVSCPIENKQAFEKLAENYLKLQGDPVAFKQVMCFFRKYQNKAFVAKDDKSYTQGLRLNNKRYIAINDLNRSADSARLYLLDLQTGDVSVQYTAHGSAKIDGEVELFQLGKTSPERWQTLMKPAAFSNISGSNATPRGAFILGKTYTGSYGYSLRMHGIQKDVNDNTFSRYVIVHGFKGMNKNIAKSSDPEAQLKVDGNLALSQGCTMMETGVAKQVIDRLQGGSLYVNYTPYEKEKGADYCLDENLLLKSK